MKTFEYRKFGLENTRVRKLGADDTINYKSTPDWDKEVFRLTDKVEVLKF